MNDQVIIHDKYLLHIAIIAGIFIFIILSISYPVVKQEEIIRASKTLGVMLLIILGMFLVIFYKQNLSKEEKTYEIISPTA